MKIQIEQKELSKHINIAQKAISSRSTLQILDGIKLETHSGQLKLVATDLEISIETYIPCKIEEEGSIVINSRIFGDIIRKLPQETIYIYVNNNKVNIKCLDSEFNLIGNNAEEYPDLPVIFDSNSFSIQKDVFKNSIRQTVFATSQDETRPVLTGVLLEVVDKEISFVSLDGYRLALKKVTNNTHVDTKMIIPARTLNEINKIIEDEEEEMEISFSKGNIIFNIGETKIYSRLLDGQFFNYKEIIRSDHDTYVIVNKRDFQNSLERASLLAKEEKANLIRLIVSDEEILIKSNSEIGDVNEKIDASVEGNGIEIAFNSRYLLEGIKIIDSEEIRLSFKGELNPCIIEPLQDEKYLYLVLPVRLAQREA